MNKGEIWFVELPESNGHEQSGLRPVIVINEIDAGMVLIIPFTSNIQALRYTNTIQVKPTKTNGLKENSIALIFQLRAIDKKRLLEKIGNLEKEHQEQINKMLKKILTL
ncbi:MAG: type II toxin-antitoxin system PemK/MazF family toxin [Candidatus Diapherotrites archaeon]|nr:type II toxin-antitoxin system PemK/MazF family toxin [Candidatus Diapherotrites archaeon]